LRDAKFAAVHTECALQKLVTFHSPDRTSNVFKFPMNYNALHTELRELSKKK